MLDAVFVDVLHASRNLAGPGALLLGGDGLVVVVEAAAQRAAGHVLEAEAEEVGLGGDDAIELDDERAPEAGDDGELALEVGEEAVALGRREPPNRDHLHDDLVAVVARLVDLCHAALREGPLIHPVDLDLVRLQQLVAVLPRLAADLLLLGAVHQLVDALLDVVDFDANLVDAAPDLLNRDGHLRHLVRDGLAHKLPDLVGQLVLVDIRGASDHFRRTLIVRQLGDCRLLADARLPHDAVDLLPHRSLQRVLPPLQERLAPPIAGELI
mmetsp:Transcript_18210/g.57241  ORF Transcript_18210/g.57241 Transcript_18210/m.57241 type:complete len:269 (+) Transcript_18210:827-1633(+)